MSVPLPYSLPWLPFFRRIWYTELIKSSIRCWKNWWFFSPGQLQQQWLGQVLRAQLRLPRCSCLLGDRLSSVISFKLLFREDYQFFFSKLLIVHHSEQVFKQIAYEFWGEFGLNSRSRATMIQKPCFCILNGERNWGFYWNLGFKLEPGCTVNRWRGVLLTWGRPPTHNSPLWNQSGKAQIPVVALYAAAVASHPVRYIAKMCFLFLSSLAS